MRFQLDLTKEYGIVLEGGGARGSYQIGAWKALREAGIKIRGIAEMCIRDRFKSVIMKALAKKGKEEKN